MVLLAPLVLRDQQVQRVILDRLVQQEQMEQLVLQDQRVLQAQQDRRDQRVPLALQALPVHQVQQQSIIGKRQQQVEKLHSQAMMTMV
jgi:hypothetical protein